jgi:type IV pilus assembly protein PilC
MAIDRDPDPKLNPTELRDFFVQFHVLFGAGVPIMPLLHCLAGSEQPRVALIARGLERSLSRGASLSQSMAKFPASFDALTRASVKMGEESGKLVLAFRRLCAVFERRLELRQRMIGAFAYPLCVVAVSLALAFILSHLMLPQILPVIVSLNVDLPFLTRCLLVFVNHQWLTLGPLGLFLLVSADLAWNDGERHKDARQRLLFASPVVGRVSRAYALASLCKELATLNEVGHSILDSFRALGEAVPDRRLGETLLEIHRDVRNGQELADAVNKRAYLTPLVQSAIITGLETGMLSQTLEAAASILDVDVEARTDQLFSLIEPLTLLVLGGLVGGTLLACFLPLYSLIAGGL